MFLVSTLALLATSGPLQPMESNVFTKTRSDGVSVLCVRHDKRPSILSSKVQCNTVAGWRAAARDSALTVTGPGYAVAFATQSDYTSLRPR